MFILKPLVQIFFFLFCLQASSIGDCDDRTSCRDRVVKFTKNTGQAVHYIDITGFDHYNGLRDGFTFETHFRSLQGTNFPEKQFLAGVWGPFDDKNDSWVVYINQNKELVFELNSLSEDLVDEDNTRALYSMADSLDNRWYHLACVFDPSSTQVMIYLDGELKATASNPNFPATRLRQSANSSLGIQIGSTNALYNTGKNYNSFLGEMDEIRIWSRPLSAFEILCSKDENAIGNEQGLEVYYRCNDNPNSFEMCDATGRGRIGLMRSGTQCANPSGNNYRPELWPYEFTQRPSIRWAINENNQNILVDTIKCVTRKDYIWRFIDTSECDDFDYFVRSWEWRVRNNGTMGWVSNRNLTNMEWDPVGRNPLPKETEVEAKVTLNADFVGTRRYLFRIYKEHREKPILQNSGVANANRLTPCGYLPVNDVNVYVTRITDVNYSTDTLNFGILLANCVNNSFKDLSINLTNNTVNTAEGNEQPRNININDFELSNPEIFEVVSPGALPSVMSPNQNQDVVVRFKSNNTPGIYRDTLKIYTGDECEPFRSVPLVAEIREVISIFRGGNEVDTVDFGTHCVSTAVHGSQYFWENLYDQNITVDSIVFPPQFGGAAGDNVTLEPEQSNSQRYYFFSPRQPGNYLDSIMLYITAADCRIERPVYVKGVGIQPELFLEIDTLDLGKVLIGQTGDSSFTVGNISTDNARMRNYLFLGENFEIKSNALSGVNIGTQRDVDIQFRPLEPKVYYDFVAVEERDCGQAQLVVVKGEGVDEAFDYSPNELRIDGVTSCFEKIDTFNIKNVTSQEMDLSQFNLLDPSGKYEILEPQDFDSYSTQLQPNEEIMIVVKYVPNDQSRDRSDIAYVQYNALGELWEYKITATSIVPRLFMTQEVPFGSLEINEVKLDTILVENISSSSISIDGFELQASNGGFTMISPDIDIDTILGPRDVMEVVVEFSPDQEIEYLGELFVLVTDPCEIPVQFAVSTELSGFGKIVPLDFPIIDLFFGQVSPCDCITETVILRNRSIVNPVFLDSIWIDDMISSATVTSAEPQYYSWSTNQIENQLPIEVPAREVDSLYITYCPRSPFIRDSLTHNGGIHVKASGPIVNGEPIWVTQDEFYLSGKQMMLFETMPIYREFPPTSIDTTLITQNASTTIPGVLFNQNSEPIRIDSIRFVPDEKVFSVSSTFSENTPFFVSPEETVDYEIDFRPRAPRDYSARMYIYINDPCPLIDSTLEVFGSGFAQNIGVEFFFKDTTTKAIQDTFSIADCDTLELPVYINRDITNDPQIEATVVNINCRVYYDTTRFKFLDLDSYYLREENSCDGFDPSYNFRLDTNSYVNLNLRNLCEIDTTQPLFYAKFLPYNFDSGSQTFSVDSIFFDSEDVLKRNLIVQKDFTVGRVEKADIEILDDFDFGIVNVLDCRTDSIEIQNTGEVDLSIHSVFENVDWVEILRIEPDLDTILQPSEISKIVYRYCPRGMDTLNELSVYEIIQPCTIIDSNKIYGRSYAPPYPIETGFSSLELEDTLSGTLGEIITVPLYFRQDMVVEYNDTTYWMEDFSFDLDINYNPRALRYLDFSSDLIETTVNQELGKIHIEYNMVDSLRFSQIGELQFEITLADSIESAIDIITSDYTADILFYDLFPILNNSIMNSTGACNLDYLQFTNSVTNLSQNNPNPIVGNSTIIFSTSEKAPISFTIYDVHGNLVKKVYDGSKIFEPGVYQVEINSNDFNSGVYYYVLESGIYKETKKMVISN